MSIKHIRNLFLTGLMLFFTVYVNASARVGKENVTNPDIQTRDSLINILHFSKLYISKSDTVGIGSMITKEAEFKKPVTNIINIGNYPNAVWIKTVVPSSIDLKDYTDILIDQPRLKQRKFIL